MFNTLPYNSFPASSEKFNEGKNDAIQAEIDAIKDGTNIDSFGDVETALALKANSTDMETELATKTNLSNIAPTFDAESGVYEIGDKVIYEGVLYEFTSAHSTAGDWDSSEVQAVKISELIDTLKSGLTHLESGTETFTDLTAGTNDFVTVYFGRAYTSAPIVMATIDADGVLSGASCAVRDITTNTAKIYARNGGATDATIKVQWGAIGI